MPEAAVQTPPAATPTESSAAAQLATTPDAAAQLTTEPPAVVPSPTDAWYSSLSLSDDDVGYIQNKGFKDAASVVKSYRELETFRGASPEQLITLPKDPTDKEAMKGVYSKLGCPKTHEEYDFKMPEGLEVNQDFLSGYKQWAHEAGMNQQQAQLVIDKYNGHIMESLAKNEKELEITQKAELEALRGEWAGAYDERIELGKRAVKRYEVDQDYLNKEEKAVGSAAMLKKYAKIGESMGEGRFIESDGGDERRFGQTHEQLNQERTSLLSEIIADPKRNEAYRKSQGADYIKMQKLYKALETAARPIS